MGSKLEFTKAAIVHISDKSIDLNHAMVLWWQNLRPQGGLRLSDQGFNAFSQQLELICYRFKFSDRKYLDAGLLLDLDKKLKFPYYIDKKNCEILFFGSSEAVLNSLYGDLKNFIKHY